MLIQVGRPTLKNGWCHSPRLGSRLYKEQSTGSLGSLLPDWMLHDQFPQTPVARISHTHIHTHTHTHTKNKNLTLQVYKRQRTQLNHHCLSLQLPVAATACSLLDNALSCSRSYRRDSSHRTGSGSAPGLSYTSV